MQATGNNQNQSYILSIRLRADGLSFYGCNTAQAGQVAIEHYPYAGRTAVETLRQALDRSPMLRECDSPTTYALTDSPSMQVPLECFRKEDVHTLYRLTYAQEKTGKTYYNILPHLEVAQIFTVDPETEHLLRLAFPGIRFYHSHSMILEKLWLLQRQDTPKTLYACFDGNQAFLFCYKEQKLQYANTFPADKADNAAYFLLSVWKGLGLDAGEDTCVLAGRGEAKDETALRLERFLPHVQNTEATDIFRRSALARNPQVPFDLLALLVHVI